MGLGSALKKVISGGNHKISSFYKNPLVSVGGYLNDITGATDMYNKEYEGNVALWNMQNEYNTPASQIARMKAAGIDVNPMTYAVGNGNMSTSAGNISAPSVGASGVNPISTLMSVVSGIKDLKMASQQKKNLEAVEDYIKEQMRGERIRNTIEDQAGMADVESRWLEYKMMKDGYNAYLEDKKHHEGKSYRWSRNVGEWMSALSPFVSHVSDDASYQFFSRIGRRR